MAKPWRRVSPRLKNATHPTNIAQTGKVNIPLVPAATAAMTAAIAVARVNAHFD
ncbi:hypothetical protein C4J93_0256 [Pseudomonas sp. R2-37-08W]|nr:hypothetical protein C4J93_0256 [Pseudomonas sp. R2-37-08W]